MGYTVGVPRSIHTATGTTTIPWDRKLTGILLIPMIWYPHTGIYILLWPTIMVYKMYTATGMAWLWLRLAMGKTFYN
jgi:hypothetical protein